VQALRLDVTQPADIAAAVETISKAGRGLYGLVNNAGVATIGTIADRVSTPAHPIHVDAGFSVSGWLAVLLTFLLARVFAEGTLMRDDLEGTV
jgi:NAD(P)-dependent dehydrogenase (short-subunit alcohol dehydrogenase family)